MIFVFSSSGKYWLISWIFLKELKNQLVYSHIL